jgi:hypothetical protein
MGSLALQSVELKVEQIVVGGLADTELHAEVYGSPTIATEEDHYMRSVDQVLLGQSTPRRT